MQKKGKMLYWLHLKKYMKGKFRSTTTLILARQIQLLSKDSSMYLSNIPPLPNPSFHPSIAPSIQVSIYVHSFINILLYPFNYLSIHPAVGRLWCRGRAVDAWSQARLPSFPSMCQSVFGEDTKPHIYVSSTSPLPCIWGSTQLLPEMFKIILRNKFIPASID